jgi:phosphatidylserine/phosphatidylglycerophosphate/cardiolipin synthase-like enzyme
MGARLERLVVAPAARRRSVLATIRAARHRLVLSIFRCDDARVLHALAGAAARGVSVCAIVTPRAKAGARRLDRLCGWLGANGVDVRRGAWTKYHAKYVVADDRIALVTSLNFTSKCFARTCDFLLVTSDPVVVSGLSALFAADWVSRPPELTAAQRERLIVGPDDNPRRRFASLLTQARHRIRLIDAKLTDPFTRRLLDERRRAGVTVEIAHRRTLRPLRSHGKLLVIDDSIAVIGSLALSPASLDRRRELALVLRHSGLVATLDRFWEAHCEPRRPTASRGSGPFVELVS